MSGVAEPAEMVKFKPISEIEEQRKQLESIRTDVEKKLMELDHIAKQMREQEQNIKYASDIINEKLGDILE